MKRDSRQSVETYFLGIDGGGSRTTAWLANGRKQVLSRAVAGPSNPAKVGLAAAERHTLECARRACRGAGLGRRPLEAVCAGVAGIIQPSMHGELLRCLKRGIPARHHLLTHDAAIALECALGGSAGVIVISGTGSIGYGRDEKNRVLRCGGWGSTFDDAGSGFDVGRKAIAAALRDFDRRGPPTRLGKDICRALGISEITQAASKALTPDQVAALFPLVDRAARARDRVARQLCREAGRDLAELAAALLLQMNGKVRRYEVVCSGGVFKGSALVRRSFADFLRRVSPGVRVALLRREPVEGALALAMACARLRMTF